jgi:hypothetical protein
LQQYNGQGQQNALHFAGGFAESHHNRRNES